MEQQQQQDVLQRLQQRVLQLQTEMEMQDILQQVDQLRQAELQAWRDQLQSVMAVQQLAENLAPGNENHLCL